MGRKWFLWLAAVLVGSALTFPPVFAQVLQAAEVKKEKAKPKTLSATGEIVSVDAPGGMLAVKVKDKELSFTAATKAAKDALGKLKKGDRVTVSYTEEDGKMMASSVKAAKAPAKKPEKAPAK